jgi:cytosine/adenosine deaminase-related metal-dependent hydrolase
MRAAEAEMMESGITSFLDFREQGLDGVRSFRRAVGRIRGLAYGRPAGEASPGDLAGVCKEADGVGLDRVSAYEDEGLETIREVAGNKPIGVHVLESRWRAGEIEKALDVLGASMLVHLTHAREGEIGRIAEEGRRAVVCPRSNLSLGCGAPPLDRLLSAGVDLGLGTDNFMINSPNMFTEMEFALALMRDKKPEEVVKMATSIGAKVAGISAETGSIEEGKLADIVVIRRGRGLAHVKNIHAGLVKRTGPRDVILVLKGGEPVLDRRDRDAR